MQSSLSEAHLEEAEEDHQEEEGRASVSLPQDLVRLVTSRCNLKELEELEGPPASCGNRQAPERTSAQ